MLEQMLKRNLLQILILWHHACAQDFCPSSCRDCDELGHCLTCRNYRYLQLYDCVETCSDGFFPDGDKCRDCPWECESCSTQTECTSCRMDFYYEDGKCLDSCSTGHYLDGDSCRVCQKGCLECWEADECVQCQSHLFLQENLCVDKCSYGYSLVPDRLCLPCKRNCEICDGPSQQCEKCRENLFLKGKKCIDYDNCSATGIPINGICKPKKIKIPRKQLLRLSTLIHLPKKTRKNYRVVFTNPGRGHLFIATPMDGWPTYVLPDWKQPMAIDGESIIENSVTEISGDDLDNAWYRPMFVNDDKDDVLNYQIYSNDEVIDESEFELELMDDVVGQIRPNPNLPMVQTVPIGSSRILRNLEFISSDGIKTEDIVYIIVSRLPAGFATIERDPYGTQLEFTQFDINQGDVTIKTTDNWPGHDLTFEFLVQDPQGTTIDPYTFTVRSPKLKIKQHELHDIDLLELGVDDEALYDESAFLLLKKSPQFGDILNEDGIMPEESSTGTDSMLIYSPHVDSNLDEDAFVLSLYWNGIQEDISVMVEIEKYDLFPERYGTLVLDIDKSRTQVKPYALEYRSRSSGTAGNIVYHLIEDPLWGILEKKIGNKYSPLAWGSEFSQDDINNANIFYHYYGSDQKVDSLGLNIKDTINNMSVDEKLEMQIVIDHSQRSRYTSVESQTDYGDEESYSEIDFSDISSTIPPNYIMSVPRNSKKILKPEDLGILTPSASDWIEIHQKPLLGEIKMADNGQVMKLCQLQSIMDGMVIYQAGNKLGNDVVKFKIYTSNKTESKQILDMQINVVDKPFKKYNARVDTSTTSTQTNIRAFVSSPISRSDSSMSSSDTSPFVNDFSRSSIQSVKKEIKSKPNKVKIINEHSILPGTNKNTRFKITAPPINGKLKLLTEAGSKTGRVLSFGDVFTRGQVQDGRLCYMAVNVVGHNAVTVRKDSFNYTTGSGENKRFGEITIRVEDILLTRTKDPSAPGSEIPVANNGAFLPDLQVNQIEPSGDKSDYYYYNALPDFRRYSTELPLSGAYNHFKTFFPSAPIMTLSNIQCGKGMRRTITQTEIFATDDLESEANVLEFTIQRDCRHGNIEHIVNGDWVKVDTFTLQDVVSGEVSYIHDGSDTTSDKCIMFVSNDHGGQSDENTFEISINSRGNERPRIAINAGLMYLEYINNIPTGQITSAVLSTIDPDTGNDRIIYEVYDGPKHGVLFNTLSGTKVTRFSQADVDNKYIEYMLDSKPGTYNSDEFGFTVLDSKHAIKGNIFHIMWSVIEFTNKQVTVAEDETEVKVMIKRTGHLNHYAIVTCRYTSQQQHQQQVQFEPGEKVKPCVVPLNSDNAFQGEREIQLQLVEPTYAVLGSMDNMLLIINDPEDMPTISFLTDEIHISEEDTSLVIPLRREGDSSVTATVICYTIQGTAGNADFETRDRLENNQLVFMGMPFNERDSTCEVNIIDDSLFEENEFFFVKLEKASYNARLGKIDTVKVIIDGPNDWPIIEMKESKIKVHENSGQLEVEIIRSGSDLSQSSEVFCYSRAVTAETGQDFIQVQQQVTFEEEDERGICRVTIIDDAENQLVEGEEEFVVYLSSAVGATLGEVTETKVIISDTEEDIPRFEFGEPAFSASEALGIVSVPVYRRGDSSQEASVICRTLRGSADIEADFMERTSTELYRISFPPGQIEKPCEVIMIDDESHEDDETFFLQLKDPRSSTKYPAALGHQKETKIIITNDEDIPTITFSRNELSVREPEPGKTREVTVHTKRVGDTSGNSRVRVSTRDGSAISGVDYEPRSEMLRFLPNMNDLVFKIVVKCNENSAWHKTFSLVMGPDEPINAVLGVFSTMTVTILDKEAAGSLVLPSPPIVISLEDFNKPKSDVSEPKTGYPIICITPCDKENQLYPETETLCNEAGINNEFIRYSWEIALPDSSNFERLSDMTPWTDPKSKVLDSIYFKPKCRVRCIAKAYSAEGKGGIPLKSMPVTISSEGYCHNPIVGGSPAFQAQNFHTELEYLDSNDKDHQNSVRIKVEVPHEDGLLPIISTSRIHNIDFLLRNEVFRQQHVCSNLLSPSQAPKTIAGRGFTDNYVAIGVPHIPGYDFPHQFDVKLRGKKTLALYQYLNLKSCTWTFETFYTMTELAQTCGGHISKDFEYAKRGKSHVTVKVPFYVSYIYVQAPTGWASLQHQSELEISFSYSNVMWRTGLQTDSEMTGEILIDRVSIDTYGRLVVEFTSKAHFRGMFITEHHTLGDTKAEFRPPMSVQTNFTLELVWSEETYDSPVQHWKAVSQFSRKDYTGEYDLNLIPCAVQPTQGYLPAQVPPNDENGLPNSSGLPMNPGSQCSAQEPTDFKIKIAFQQSNRPVPVVYSLDTFFHITNSKQIFLTDPKDQNLEEIDYKGTFSKGSRIYARVLWEPKQDLRDAYRIQLEKVYLCTGSNGYVPTYDPSGEIYGQGPQYGCIRPIKDIAHRFLILDRGNRDAEYAAFQDIKFEAEFASDNAKYLSLHKVSSCDGFSFKVDPLYKVIAGHEWYLQILYIIGSSKGRMRRSAEMINVDTLQRSRRAAANEYIKTIESMAQNGTNMHFLKLESHPDSLVGIIIGVVGTSILLLLASLFIYRRNQQLDYNDVDMPLTTEEEALVIKKLGTTLNNQSNIHHKPHDKHKLNNQNYKYHSDRRNEVIIKNHLSTKVPNSPHPQIKIHNNLRSAGTEI